MIQLLKGNNLETLKTIQDNSIDPFATDSPYGLKFMGKKWDYDVPSIELWKECFRVLKHGGHLLSFGGTRTYHRLVVNIEDAGFEIRDCIQWLYGSGFPKSHNIKEGDFKGWGTALKPANEPICVARKPLEKGLKVAQNVLKYGTGAINIDASRIGTDSTKRPLGKSMSGVHIGSQERNERPSMDKVGGSDCGRWPANIILDEVAAELLDEHVKGRMPAPAGNKNKTRIGHGSNIKFNSSIEDVEASRFQLGGDPQTASRFFYVAKASKSERNKGLEGMPLVESGIKNDSGRGFSESDPHKKILNQNFHPTVKPTKLMQYLIKLVTPPNGTVLDPFMGSGSTGVAAKELGFSFVGCELSPEYFEIAQKRIEGIK